MTFLRTTSLTIRALVAVALVGSILIPAGHGLRAAAVSTDAPAPSVPGEIVVRYRPGTGESSRYSVRAATGATLVSRLPIERTELVDVGTEDLATAIARISARPEVLYAEPNFIYQGAATPDDARFQALWGMDNQGQEVLGLRSPLLLGFGPHRDHLSHPIGPGVRVGEVAQRSPGAPPIRHRASQITSTARGTTSPTTRASIPSSARWKTSKS